MNLLPTTKHKLARRTTPCVFLGYPTDHRGYQCLDITTKEIILSRHVVFVESVFPFTHSSTQSNSRSSPLLLPLLLFCPTQSATAPPASPQPPSPSPPPSPLAPSPPPSPQMHHAPPAPLPTTHSMVTQAKSGIVKLRLPVCLHTDSSISHLPLSHVQAANDPFLE